MGSKISIPSDPTYWIGDLKQVQEKWENRLPISSMETANKIAEKNNIPITTIDDKLLKKLGTLVSKRVREYKKSAEAVRVQLANVGSTSSLQIRELYQRILDTKLAKETESINKLVEVLALWWYFKTQYVSTTSGGVVLRPKKF